MSDVLLNSPPPASGSAIETAISLVGWLDDLLDLARARDDAPLAKLIAGVMDDLGRAAKR